jgi:hypothetical protein
MAFMYRKGYVTVKVHKDASACHTSEPDTKVRDYSRGRMP